MNINTKKVLLRSGNHRIAMQESQLQSLLGRFVPAAQAFNASLTPEPLPTMLSVEWLKANEHKIQNIISNVVVWSNDNNFKGYMYSFISLFYAALGANEPIYVGPHEERTSYGPGVYLIGDIVTYSQIAGLESLGEGVHILENGCVITLFSAPDWFNTDNPMYDQDNNSYMCESGYIGIVRADYLPMEFYENHAIEQNKEYDNDSYSIPYWLKEEQEGFTVSKGYDDDDTCDFYAIGPTFISPRYNENADIDFTPDDDDGSLD